MERRAHWTDDLIEAVSCLVSVDIGDDCLVVADVFRIIAAVEDWHKAKRDSRVRTHSEGCWRWHNECAESLIEWQQAAIQRVQAVCDKPNRGPSWDSYVEGYNDAISVVQAAMEGEVDA